MSTLDGVKTGAGACKARAGRTGLWCWKSQKVLGLDDHSGMPAGWPLGGVPHHAITQCGLLAFDSTPDTTGDDTNTAQASSASQAMRWECRYARITGRAKREVADK